MMLRVAFAIPLILACGLATVRFFSYLFNSSFAWNLTVLRSKFFWMGVFFALLFLWSDFRFARIFNAGG